MRQRRDGLTSEAANSSDYHLVAVLFADPTITFLFSSLLEGRGVHTRIIHDVAELSETAKIITEPQYYTRLTPAAQRKCLLVCSRQPRDEDVLYLSQPLTEDKVEAALARFLA